MSNSAATRSAPGIVFESSAGMKTAAHAPHLDSLTQIVEQYLEMPGLSLTLAQARRLFGLGGDVCARHLEYLVQQGFLTRTSRGLYVRPTYL
jgi:hypothetical protein